MATPPGFARPQGHLPHRRRARTPVAAAAGSRRRCVGRGAVGQAPRLLTVSPPLSSGGDRSESSSSDLDARLNLRRNPGIRLNAAVTELARARGSTMPERTAHGQIFPVALLAKDTASSRQDATAAKERSS